MVASLRDWSSLLFEWNVCRGDHCSPVCVIEIQYRATSQSTVSTAPLKGSLTGFDGELKDFR